jgi:hypothetical protein
VFCHGGAGTIQAFIDPNIEISIIPQAYDQTANAEWYKEHKYTLEQVDLQKEYVIFQKNVMKIFSQHLPLLDLQQTNLDIPLYNKRWTKNDLPIVIKYKCTWEDKCAVITKKDCILISFEKIFGEGTKAYKKLKQKYEEIVNLRHFHTFEDVCNLVLASSVSATIVHKETNTAIKFDYGHKQPFLSVAIAEGKMHANVVEVTSKDKVSHKVLDTIYNKLPATEVSTMNSLLLDFKACLAGEEKQSGMLDQRDIETFRASMRLEHKDRCLVLIRKASPFLLLETESAVGFCKTKDKRIKPWCCYGLLTDKGYVVGVSVAISGAEDNIIYHALSEELVVSGAISLHGLKSLSLTTKKNLNISSEITAVNQATYQECHKQQIPVQTVCSLNATICYLNTTWNRKHHLEKERECILSAKMLKSVMGEFTDVEILHVLN